MSISKQDLDSLKSFDFKYDSSIYGSNHTILYNEIIEVRGAGLLLGIKMRTSNKKINELFCEKGLLTLIASDNIVRLAPPLIITNKEVDKAIEIMKKVLEDMNG